MLLGFRARFKSRTTKMGFRAVWFFWIYCFAVPLYTVERMEILLESPRVVVYHSYLSDAECDHIIRFGASSLQRSTVVDHQSNRGMVDPVRTSEGMFFPYHHQDSILTALEKKISLTTGIPKENGENIQLLHYPTGAEYKPHHDYFDPDTLAGKEYLKTGGQRYATFIMYLNTPEGGGETVFPLLNLKIKAKKGDALLFYNCDFQGNVDRMTLHGGAPVTLGEKWIATRWLRLGRFY
jgi:prolyl 4-hydroxylase